jgi:hypothetical protein
MPSMDFYAQDPAGIAALPKVPSELDHAAERFKKEQSIFDPDYDYDDPWLCGDDLMGSSG